MARRAVRILVAALAALGLAVTVTGCVRSASDPAGPTDPSPTDPGGQGVIGTAQPDELACRSTNDTPGVAVIADRSLLVFDDGRAFPLTGIAGGALGGYQTCDGWLVHGGSGPYSLWLVRPDGSLHQVVAQADAPVAVAPDGKHIAWRWAGELNTARVNPTGTTTIDVSSPAPSRGHPISLSATVVVLGYSSTGGGIDNHDVWTPSAGDYVPTWSEVAHVRVLYGPAPDGRRFLGLVEEPTRTGRRHCLAELDPQRGLAPRRTACGLPFALNRLHDIDPEGRWLAAVVTEEEGERTLGVVDLTTVFETPTPTLAAVLSGPRVTDAAFEDATRLLAAPAGGGLARAESPFAAWTPASRPGVNPSTSITALLPRRV